MLWSVELCLMTVCIFLLITHLNLSTSTTWGIHFCWKFINKIILICFSYVMILNLNFLWRQSYGLVLSGQWGHFAGYQVPRFGTLQYRYSVLGTWYRPSLVDSSVAGQNVLVLQSLGKSTWLMCHLPPISAQFARLASLLLLMLCIASCFACADATSWMDSVVQWSLA